MSAINSILWYITTLFIVFTSIYIIFYIKKRKEKIISIDSKISKEDIKLLNITLASKIGVGSISGIAISIIVGGKGTIFWIWISSLVLSTITYIETKVGIRFRNNNIGGPQIYIKEEIGSNKLSFIYSFLIILIYLFAFILIQSNTIIKSIFYTFNINKYLIIFILVILTYISINKGINSVSKIVSFLVPIMATIYIIIGLFLLFKYMDIIPIIIKEIIIDAFSIKSIFTLPIIIGFQRSVFSNESGMGTTSMVVALSNTNNYIKESKVQILGLLFINIVICSISALIILTTDYYIFNVNNINGIEIINYAFNYHFGSFGSFLSTIIISLFAFSTIITAYYYGDICLNNILNKKNSFSKIIVIIVISISILISSNVIWNMVDILCALVTIINLYALYKLRSKI